MKDLITYLLSYNKEQIMIRTNKGIKLIGDHVLVKEIEKPITTKSGIIISGRKKNMMFSNGIIKDIGNGAMDKNGNRQKIPLEVGQEIVFAKATSTDIEIMGEKMKIITLPNVFVTIDR